MADQKAEVFYNEIPAGILSKKNGKYFFKYYGSYLDSEKLPPISLGFPKRKQEFSSDVLFPFFYGLLSEGENKSLLTRINKIDKDDFFSLLIKTAATDTIGAITVREI